MNACMCVRFPDRAGQTTKVIADCNLSGAGLSLLPVDTLPGHPWAQLPGKGGSKVNPCACGVGMGLGQLGLLGIQG